jgi:hypothetical protein
MSALSNGTTAIVNPIVLRGDGLRHRKMDAREQLETAVGLWLGSISINHFTLSQISFLLPDVTRGEIYLAARAYRNGNAGNGDHVGNGGHGGNHAGNGNNPASAAELAADLVAMVGREAAFDVLSAISSTTNGG